jgi:hypothetical protein
VLSAKTKAEPIKVKTRYVPLPASVRALLSRAQVCEALGGCSLRKLNLMIRDGEFPAADSRLGRNPRWSVDLFNSWYDQHRNREA